MWNLCPHSKKDIFPFDIFQISTSFFIYYIFCQAISTDRFFLWFTVSFSFSVCSSSFMVDHQSVVSGFSVMFCSFFACLAKWKLLFLRKYTFEQDLGRPLSTQSTKSFCFVNLSFAMHQKLTCFVLKTDSPVGFYSCTILVEDAIDIVSFGLFFWFWGV